MGGECSGPEIAPIPPLEYGEYQKRFSEAINKALVAASGSNRELQAATEQELCWLIHSNPDNHKQFLELWGNSDVE